MHAPVRPAVLLVDDDATLLGLLARRLTREGFEVRTAPSGAGALAALERGWPSIIIVDLMMPTMDGFELSRRIKRMADLPIIVLSAVETSESKVRALEDYADDYVTKPFDPDELVARIQRVLRRSSPGRSAINLNDGELELDLATKQVKTRAGVKALTPTETRFLGVLAAALDRTVPTETLLDRVWSDADGADPAYVWVTVRRLRRKLEVDPDRPRYLLTDRGIGYRLSSIATT